MLDEIINDERSKSKYKNKKCEYDGIKFDSEIERDFYIYLLSMFLKEHIKLHPKFVLQPSYTKHDKKIQPITYAADFQVGNKVWDVKGAQTHDFVIKKKMFGYIYPALDLILITKCPVKYQHITNSEWVSLEVLAKLRSANLKLKKKGKDK